jgi:uncharacterized membrane protein
MAEQNFSNHKRYDPLYHFVLMPASLLGLVLSIINLINAAPIQHYNAALLVIVFIILFIIVALTRIYSLKVQNRIIRTEENFRHFILTGKPLDPHLRMGQIVALRFASDEEVPVLTARAVNEKMSATDIKKSIKNWRADYYRI